MLAKDDDFAQYSFVLDGILHFDLRNMFNRETSLDIP